MILQCLLRDREEAAWRGDGATGLRGVTLFLAVAAGLRARLAVAGERERRCDDAVKLIESLTGKTPTPSDRVRLVMPAVFPNGYTVPLVLDIDSPMTETDHVRYSACWRREIRSSRSPPFISPGAQPSPCVDSHPPRRTAIRLGGCRDERRRAAVE